MKILCHVVTHFIMQAQSLSHKNLGVDLKEFRWELEGLGQDVVEDHKRTAVSAQAFLSQPVLQTSSPSPSQGTHTGSCMLKARFKTKGVQILSKGFQCSTSDPLNQLNFTSLFAETWFGSSNVDGSIKH